jgi:DNA-nicking Smr family endonuclease
VSKKSKGFNTPFADLAKIDLGKPPPNPATTAAPRPATATAATPPTAPTPAATPPTAPTPAATPAAKTNDDERSFLDEMQGVAQLPADPRGRHGPAVDATAVPEIRRRRASEEAEAYAELADLVQGAGVFDISATDEYIEGLAPGIDRRLLKKLRAGDYAVQAHLDLHGMSSEEAHGEVDQFLVAARTAGRRCVLIIHGRGHGSKEGIPVLKERLRVWLTRGRIGRGVLAFCSARPSDGGAGAVYVLLRK